MHTSSPTAPATGWDAHYEFKAVALLALGFGLVGLDRFIIHPLFPVMQKDLGLDYRDLGLISAALALTWGIASVWAGRLADRIGRKRVLVPSIVLFSVLVAMSGLATGLVSLLLIRALMGLAEGAYVPASIIATTEASKPTRTGLNVGIQQMAAPLVGLGLGPLVALGLLNVLPSWHWVFGVVAIPGLIVAALIAKVLRDVVPVRQQQEVVQSPPWGQTLKHRAVIVNTLAMMCYLTCLITLSAFMPNYLTDHVGLSLDQMGLVLAGIGVGSCAGMVVVPAVSDKVGRKPVIVAALLIELLAIGALIAVARAPGELFAALFVATFMNAGVVAINVGPLTSGSVPPHLVATATGIVVGLGEIVGGAIAPAVAGALAHSMGITVIPLIALASVAVGLMVVVFGVREPEKRDWRLRGSPLV
ncbi:MFS family permease [Hydrogenophaga palleronii]|uniref:MFS family permease n=1 Tax=Hydrogenophaga palleronii TaxID=65655 RepID=A0ABU1WRW2_9BURK|nr:MFS transporter [Hydrogenophaga palleronii]MDR7152031.1 MFS family permease [Hydrogenophaga palleronii]